MEKYQLVRETSCVVVPDAGKPSEPKAKKLSGVAQTALKALDVLAADKRLPETSAIPNGARGADLQAWRATFLTLYGEKGSSNQAQDRAFRRAKEELLKEKTIGICDPWVWRCAARAEV